MEWTDGVLVWNRMKWKDEEWNGDEWKGSLGGEPLN